MQQIIQFNHISKNFGGVHALSNVSFGITTGEVHAIVGENGAGKSTLMNLLAGIFPPDSGEIMYKRKKVRFNNPAEARGMGIATVHQELRNCPNLTVSENIFLGRELTKGMVMDYRSMNQKAEQILDNYGFAANVQLPMQKLSVAQMQIVEIAKAIDLNADVLILDEPTSALTYNETEKLFTNIRKLRQNGVTILFISHRLEEIFQISDCISIMRNGKYLDTFATDAVTPKQVVKEIAGKELIAQYDAIKKRKVQEKEKVVLSVEKLSGPPMVHNVNFFLYEKEILGIYGLQGSGRTDLLETVFGVAKRKTGSIRIHNNELTKGTPREAINHKMCMLTEDRKLTGVFYNMDIRDNIAIIHDKNITQRGVISPKKTDALSKKYIAQLLIKCRNHRQFVDKLSGGNQQKVVLSRCLSVEPNIMLLDEPTRGVDVGAKSDIYELLRKLRDENGISMIVVSSELAEIIMLCDRVLVMHNGYFTGELVGSDIVKEKILQLAFKDIDA